MATDVILNDSDVTITTETFKIDGNNVKCKVFGGGLFLELPARKTNTGDRRALVHDDEDKLVINYGGDYTRGVDIIGGEHGVRIHGITYTTDSIAISGSLSVTKDVELSTLEPPYEAVGKRTAKRTLLTLDGLVVERYTQFIPERHATPTIIEEESIAITATDITYINVMQGVAIPVIKELKRLSDEIEQLKSKLNTIGHTAGRDPSTITRS